MSEYIEIESELNEFEDELQIITNLQLAADGPEQYHGRSAMEEGSPVAQALAVIEGVAVLEIDGRDLLIQRDPDHSWHTIIADVSAALKDFFL
jgi:hypothetical protein